MQNQGYRPQGTMIWPPSQGQIAIRPVPHYTFQGWGYPADKFPAPPPGVVGQAQTQWYNSLNQQYPPTDLNRYHNAWASWFNTQPGQVWNGQRHYPNWGPHHPLPATHQMTYMNYCAQRNFANIHAALTPAQQLAAQTQPVAHTVNVQTQRGVFIPFRTR
jgi:hypothetical protein